MKKLMIAAAIVCAAAMSQAATVSWGGAIAAPAYAQSGSYDDFQAYPATAVLIWSSEAFAGAATEIDKLELGGVANNGGTVIDTFSINQAASDAWVFAKTYDKSGSDVNGYYAVLVSDGADNKTASYYDLGQVTGTTALSDMTDLKVNYSWGGSAFLEQGGYTVTVGAVPEPTSGLLLLLGVAGLALRRRRA